MILSFSKHRKPVKNAICFLTVSWRSDSSKAGVCLYLGRFSIFALFLHTAQHYFVSIVFVDRLSSPGLCCFLTLSPSLTRSPSYVVTSSLSLLQFHLLLYSNNNTTLKAHKQLTRPTLAAPATSSHLPHANHPALKAPMLYLPASYCSFIPLLPPSSPFLLPLPHRQWRSFLCS